MRSSSLGCAGLQRVWQRPLRSNRRLSLFRGINQLLDKTHLWIVQNIEAGNAFRAHDAAERAGKLNQGLASADRAGAACWFGHGLAIYTQDSSSKMNGVGRQRFVLSLPEHDFPQTMNTGANVLPDMSGG